MFEQQWLRIREQSDICAPFSDFVDLLKGVGLVTVALLAGLALIGFGSRRGSGWFNSPE